MTTPAPLGDPAAEETPVTEGMTPAEQAALAALAAFAAGTAAAAAATAALLALGIPRRAVTVVLRLALLAGRRVPVDVDPADQIRAAMARREVYFRAAYLLAAARRLAVPLVAPRRPPRPAPALPPAPGTAPAPSGPPVPEPAPAEDDEQTRADELADALEREQRHLEQHLEAARRRREQAAQLAAAYRKYGRWLIWQAVMDSRTTIDCQRAHLHAFDALRPPRMGIPGAVHPSCRCKVGGRAAPGTPMIDGGQVPTLYALAARDGALELAEHAEAVELARYVRTPAGVARYKRPIGALITEKGGRRGDGPRTASGRKSRALPERVKIERAIARRKTRRDKAALAANRVGDMDRKTAAAALSRLNQPDLYAVRAAARRSLDGLAGLGPGRGTTAMRKRSEAAIRHADRELARRVDARVRGLDDDQLSAAIGSAGARGRVAELDRYLAELDRRQAAEDRAAREKARLGARRDRERADREAREAAQWEAMEQMLEQGWNEAEAEAAAFGRSVDKIRARNAIAALRRDGHKGAGFDELARSAYRAHVDQAYRAAEDATNGYLLTNAAESRGIDPRSLFTGSEARARRNASDELKAHWDEVGRVTFDEFKAQLLDDPASARRSRNARGDFLT